MRGLEGKELGRFAGSAKGKPKIEAYDKDRRNGGLITPAKVILLYLVLFVIFLYFIVLIFSFIFFFFVDI